MTLDSLIDYDAMQYPCSAAYSKICDNRSRFGGPVHARVCDLCQLQYGSAVQWLTRNHSWTMPLEWASASACLDAIADCGIHIASVSEFYRALESAVPLFAGCNFSSFARYIHALLLHARNIAGGFFLAGDWERVRRCVEWCGHAATASCAKRCNDVMRDISGLRRQGGFKTLALAGGVISVFAATRRAAKSDSSTIVRDIMSLDPLAYALCTERKLRDMYGVHTQLASRVGDYCPDGGLSAATCIVTQKIPSAESLQIHAEDYISRPFNKAKW